MPGEDVGLLQALRTRVELSYSFQETSMEIFSCSSILLFVSVFLINFLAIFVGIRVSRRLRAEEMADEDSHP